MTFAKYGNAVLGHREPMVYPKSTQKLDYEVELAVVIGRCGKYLVRDRAPDHMGGCTILNDVSARELHTPTGRSCGGRPATASRPWGPSW